MNERIPEITTAVVHRADQLDANSANEMAMVTGREPILAGDPLVTTLTIVQGETPQEQSSPAGLKNVSR